MGYHRNFGCNTGCCDDQEALASVTRTGTVLNFADTSGKQTAIDLSEILPDPNRLVSAARSGTKLNFTDNKGNVTTLDLADLIPSFDGVTDVAATTLGIRVTMSNGQTKDIDLSQIYTAPVAFNDVSRSGTTLTFTDTNGGQHTVELEAPPVAINSLSRSGNSLLFTDTNDDKHSIELEAPPVALRDVSRSGTTLTFTDTNGGQHTVELEAAPEVPVAYKGAMLNGSTLRFTDTTGATHDVDLSNLVPAGKADRFLSNVQYDPAAKKLTFTTSATGETDSTFEVNIADLLPVTVGDGLTGNGTASSPVKVNAAALKGSGIAVVDNKLTVDYDTTTMEMTEDGKLRAKPLESSGLACEAIDQLPIKPWKKDTTVLAKQDGQCIRLKPNGDIFTDVVVNISSAKQFLKFPDGQSETTNLVVTVTNAGTTDTSDIEVVLTKPMLGRYVLGTEEFDVAKVTKTSETTWSISSLASGESVQISIPVTISGFGAFTFGAQVTSTLDTDTTNNTKSITISAATRNVGLETNYVATTDCPLIEATDLVTNQRLSVYTPDPKFPQIYQNESNWNKYINVLADGLGIAGRQFKLKGASTIVVTSAPYQDVQYFDRANAQVTIGKPYPLIPTIFGGTSAAGFGSALFSKSTNLVLPINGFNQGKYLYAADLVTPVGLRQMGTFDPETEIFTFDLNLQFPAADKSFNEAPFHCVIWCRPAGENCKWQGIPLTLVVPYTYTTTAQLKYEFNSLKGTQTTERDLSYTANSTLPVDTSQMNVIGGTLPEDFVVFNSDVSLKQGLNEIRNGAKWIVTVVAGQEHIFTLKHSSGDNQLPNYISTGKTRTSYNASTKTLTVTVAADATPTDSIYWDDLKIIVK